MTSSRAIPAEYECYNLSNDPTETNNLLSPTNTTPLDEDTRKALEAVLHEQRQQKRLHPQTLNNQPSVDWSQIQGENQETSQKQAPWRR